MNRNRQNKRTTRASRRRENKALRIMSICMLAFLGMVAAIMIFMLLIWCKEQQAAQTVDEWVENQTQQAEPLVIVTPEPETEGSVTIYTNDGTVYGYFGDIAIKNDGKDGKQIDIELYGWLVEEYKHGEPEHTEESEGGND